MEKFRAVERNICASWLGWKGRGKSSYVIGRFVWYTVDSEGWHCWIPLARLLIRRKSTAAQFRWKRLRFSRNFHTKAQEFFLKGEGENEYMLVALRAWSTLADPVSSAFFPPHVGTREDLEKPIDSLSSWICLTKAQQFFFKGEDEMRYMWVVSTRMIYLGWSGSAIFLSAYWAREDSEKPIASRFSWNCLTKAQQFFFKGEGR